jgi:hypothetical protein
VGFIKIATYFPYPAKVWVNGHEWAKRQARRGRLLLPSWPTDSPHAPNPTGSRPSAMPLVPDDVQGFFDRWIGVIPAPLNADDRRAGHFWELSMRQVEVSKRLVF